MTHLTGHSYTVEEPDPEDLFRGQLVPGSLHLDTLQLPGVIVPHGQVWQPAPGVPVVL